MNPNNLKLLQKAQTLDLAGKTAEALAAYKEFLDHEPRHAEAWADYAGKLLSLGRLPEAEKACERALLIKPHQLAARINFGIILMRRNRLDEAEGHLRSALRMDPLRMDALLFLAKCLLDKRDLPGARKALERASQPGAMAGVYAVLRPQQAEHWALLGAVLLEERRFQEAADASTTALQIDPRNFRARASLGSIRMAQGQLEEAEGMFRQLLADHPQDERIRLLLITCLTRKGDQAGVLEEGAKVVQQAPDSFLVHKSVMGPYYSLGCWAEYRAEIERFRKVDPDSAYLDYEQSFVDLLSGDMLQGWERFEARLKVPKEVRPQRAFPQPAWGGGSFTGKTLLVWAEQGLGDTVMCLRYLPRVKALGGRVILETPPGLLEVASTCAGADVLLPAGSPPPPFDLQVSILSLPWIFRTDLATIPAEVPYLTVPADVPRRQALQEVLRPAQESTRIGLVWAGNANHARDHERSLSVPSLAPLAALPGVAWFSFQVGRTELPPLPNLTPLAPLLTTFADTAFALSAMDLLITVDTSVAHLAGALGIPTLLLLTWQPDYRWMLERTDSPWYPSLRLYRQPAFGDWASVLRQVVVDLAPQVPVTP